MSVKSSKSAIDKRTKYATTTLRDNNLTLEGHIILTNLIKTPSDILCLKYSNDIGILATGSSDGSVRLYREVDGATECFRTLSDDSSDDYDPSPVTSIKHSATKLPHCDTFTCTYASGYVRMWDYNTGECIYNIQEKRQVFGLAYHPTLPKFVTIGDDSKIYLYDSTTLQRVNVYEGRIKMDGHKSRIFSACFHPTRPNEFISGGWDDTVQFWDTSTPASTRFIGGVHMCGDGLDIQTSDEILTCAWQKNNSMQLWDYGSGKLISTLQPDQFHSQLYCGKWVGKETIAAGGSDPNLIRFVNQRTMISIGTISGMPIGVFSLDDGAVLKSMKDHTNPQALAQIIPRTVFSSGKIIYEVEPL